MESVKLIKAKNFYQMLDRMRWCGMLTSQEYRTYRGMIGTPGQPGMEFRLLYIMNNVPSVFSRVREIEKQEARLKQLGIWYMIHDSHYYIPEEWLFDFEVD